MTINQASLVPLRVTVEVSVPEADRHGGFNMWLLLMEVVSVKELVLLRVCTCGLIKRAVRVTLDVRVAFKSNWRVCDAVQVRVDVDV